MVLGVVLPARPRAASRIGLAGALSLLVLIQPAASPAESSLRYAALLEERLEGEAQPLSTAEQELVRRLLAGGLVFVDEAQSRKIRSVTDAGTLLGGTIAPVITTLDADVLLAGLCELSPLQSDLLGNQVARYDAGCEAKAIAVDSGEVLGSYSARGAGLDFVPRQAAAKAARAAGAELAAQLLAAPPQGSQEGRRLELVLLGVPNVSEGARVQRVLAGLPGVAGLRVLHAGRGMTKLAIDLQPGVKTQDLALALDQQPEAGITVYGSSERAIRADYDPARALQLPLLLLRPESPAGKPGEAWIGRALVAQLTASLSSVPSLRLPALDEPPAVPGPRPATWKVLLERHRLPADASLLLFSSHEAAGSERRFAVRVVSAATGGVFVALQEVCSPATQTACLGRLGERLVEALQPEKLLARRDLLPGLSRTPLASILARGGGGHAPGKPVEILALQVDDLFPAQLLAYAEQPLGKVRLRNGGDTPATDLLLRVGLPGFTRAALDLPAGSLAPGAEQEIPLKLVLDRARLARHDQNQPALLQLQLEYTVGEYRLTASRSTSLVVFDRNALSWEQVASVASFVSPSPAPLAALARSLAQQAPTASDDPLALAAALVLGLGRLGLRYAADPVNPFARRPLDTVQFPLQTLRHRTGDCDDLAVLFAALGEAAGLPILLLVSPDHVLAAVPTGLSPHALDLATLDRTGLVEHRERLWLPLETTLVGRPLLEALDEGVAQVARWQAKPDELQIVDLREAWSRYPPSDLEPEDLTLPDVAPDPGEVGDSLRVVRAAQRERAERLLAQPLPTGAGPEVAAAHNRRGLALMALGRAAEAQQAFEQSSSLGDRSGRARNNLGNLLLVQRRYAPALTTYRQVLREHEDSPHFQRNAALAAFLAGDEGAFHEHLFGCLRSGGRSRGEERSRLGRAAGGSTRGAGPDEQAGRRLGDRVRQLLASQDASRPTSRDAPTGHVAGTRASDAGDREALRLERLVIWL